MVAFALCQFATTQQKKKTISFIKFNDWVSILMILMGNDNRPKWRRNGGEEATRKRLNEKKILLSVRVYFCVCENG